MKETLIHYTDKPLTAVHSVEQDGCGGKRWDKPRGLWLSVKGEDDWAHWCAFESFGIGALAYCIALAPDANILRLSTTDQVYAFTARYRFDPPGWPEGLSHQMNIEWRRVADEYQGIVIAPYQWPCRLDDVTFWYYGWDCASGCIWDAAAVASIQQLSRNGTGTTTKRQTTGRTHDT